MMKLTFGEKRAVRFWHYHLYAKLSFWTKDLALGTDGDYRQQPLQDFRVTYRKMRAKACNGWLVATQS